jgi:hypothetical protein
MTTRSHLAAAVLVMACLQAGPLLGQSAPAPDTAATPAASPAPSATPTATSTEKAAADDGKAANEETARPKAKSAKRIKLSAQTQQEISHSLKTGTVPSRYRGKVPKEYRKYIPFER